MPRSVRIQYAGAVYHLMYRGDRREAIFLDNADRDMFLATLAEMCGRTGCIVHSYVLMSNQYHLLFETPEPNPVAGMRWFQTAYTQRFNAWRRLADHLFQGRYNAIFFEAVPDHNGTHGGSIRADQPEWRRWLKAGEYPALHRRFASKMDSRAPTHGGLPACGKQSVHTSRKGLTWWAGLGSIHGMPSQRAH